VRISFFKTKGAKDYKNFEFEIISNFSMTAPISVEEFEELTETELIQNLYKALLDFYEEKQGSKCSSKPFL
jgi:preprotein translocase subunit SecA